MTTKITYDKEWHERHKNDPNIVKARKKARQRYGERRKNDPEFKRSVLERGARWKRANKDAVNEGKKRYLKKYPEANWLDSIRRRAKKRNIPFDLTLEYLRSITPKKCPVLKISLVHNIGKRGGRDNSPSLDRLVPSKGYVVGNVIVVSKLANQIRSNATQKQIQAVATFYKKLLS